MKRSLCIAITAFLFSCTNRISEKEEDFIRLRISQHNDIFLDFLKDSVNNRMKIWDSIYTPGKSKYEIQKAIDSITAIFYRNTNIPYNPDLDDHLTYLKFMTYCRENKIDPVKAASRLRVN